MDVTNPGQVTVEDEVYANPDPNGGTARAIPRELDRLVDVSSHAQKPAANGVDAEAFPTPAEVSPDAPLYVPPVDFTPVPPAPEVVVANQCLTGVNVADFVVVGPAESFQTNATDEDLVTIGITGVYDADNLPHAPTTATTRYYLVVSAPQPLTSYPVSMLGRQLIFTSGADEGAARFITSYGASYVVINRDDSTEDNGGMPVLDQPAPGDTMSLDTARRGSEQVNNGTSTIEVFVSPPPPVNVPLPPQDILGGGTSYVSTGPQPGTTIITSGTQIPSAVNIDVPDECPVVGLPTNVFQ